MTSGIASPCVRTQWGPFGQWWCVPVELTHDDSQGMLLQILADAPVSTIDLVTDRLFGGFYCCYDPDARHVYWSGLDYSYLGENVPFEGRRDRWLELLSKKGADPNPLDGPWTEDLPRDLIRAMCIYPEGDESH